MVERTGRPLNTWRAWRTMRSRMSGAPMLLLLSAGVGFLIGLFATGEFFRSSHTVVTPSSEKVDTHRLLSSNEQPHGDFVKFREKCTDWEEVPGEDVRQFMLDNVFDGSSPFDEFPSAEIATLLQTKKIRGWGSQATVFERLLREVRPTVIVELGSFLGASAIHIGQVARNLSLNPTILCVDDFRGWPGFRGSKFHDLKIHNGENMLYHQFLMNVQSMDVADLIVPVPFATAGALTTFCTWGIRPDLIEVDAAHDFHSAWLDINLAYAILKPGGVMFGHDYFSRGDAEGVRRAVDLFARLHDLRVEPDGQHWILRSHSTLRTKPLLSS